jgi:hypothetical protein
MLRYLGLSDGVARDEVLSAPVVPQRPFAQFPNWINNLYGAARSAAEHLYRVDAGVNDSDER